MSLIATGEILQHVELLLATSRHYGEDSLYEPTPRLTVGSSAGLAIQHGVTQRPLGLVVGRLDSLDSHEGPEMCLPSLQFPARRRRLAAGALRPLLEIVPHREAHDCHVRPEGGPSHGPVPDPMPPIEQAIGVCQQPPTHFRRFTPTIDHRLEVASEMGPAKLATPDPEIALEPIANDHLSRRRPQNSFGDIGPPGRGDGEGRDRRRNSDPQPYSYPILPPRGLVDISRGCCPHMLPNLFDRSLQLNGTLTLEPGDHPDGDRQTQQVGHQFTDRSLAQAIRPGQDAEDGP